MRTLYLFSLILPLLAAGAARAEGEILLQEVLPSFSGTDLGAVPIAAPPPPGTSMVVRRADVLRALKQAGKSGRDLQIPLATRITREVVSLAKHVVLDEARAALEAAAAPCVVQQARVSAEARVIAGPRTISAELIKRSGAPQSSIMQVTGAIYLDSGGRRVRVPVVASLQCPALDVQAGSQVTVVAVVGRVRASAPGEARQGGRVGEIIRITNRSTGAALRGRILDAQTVEVVP